MVFQSRKTLAPEKSCAMVAAIDLLSVCEVEAGDRWELFCGSFLAGEEGGAESDPNIEHSCLQLPHPLEEVDHDGRLSRAAAGLEVTKVFLRSIVRMK